MKVAIVAPRPVPYVHGGAENLWDGLHAALNATPGVQADLVKLDSPERGFWEIVESYRAFSRLSLDGYDRALSTKYPAWMAEHPDHVVYLQHKLRGLYDTYPATLPTRVPAGAPLSAGLRILLERMPQDRSALEELFGLLEELRGAAGSLPPELFALPGPLIRAVVHAFDAIGLAPRAIRRYTAISHTVAERAEYFPPGAAVEVAHHPTSLAGIHNESYDAIFTASRLEPPKRVDLIIEAYRRAGVSVPLRIAGEGPELQRLRRLAAGCDAIRFLGRLSDAEMAQEYARALFVPFVPEQEDYGLITVEAMGSEKAVLTTSDAGGVTELVRHGENGLVVEADAEALAGAMRRFVREREATVAMGKRAAASIAHITWPGLVAWLLGEPGEARAEQRTASCVGAPRRRRLLVVNTFPSYPPLSGGQQRMYHLYRRLAARFEVVQVNLAPSDWRPETRLLCEGFTEVVVPRSRELCVAQARLEEALRVSAGDVVAITDYALCPQWTARIAHYAGDADFVVASHPYGYRAIRSVWQGPVIYEAHNVESDLKRQMFAERPEFLEIVRETEGACARAAPLVLACSGEDGRRLAEVYGIEAGKFATVENGVDCDSLPFRGQEARKRLKAQYGIGRSFGALFVGSRHLPNIRAAQRILRFAERCPDAQFYILGSVGEDPLLKRRPPNVHCVGVVSENEKRLWFSIADVGLNPMESGSGTNLKLMDYAAAGLPMLSTEFGARGGILSAGEAFWEAPIEEFPAALSALRAAAPGELEARTRRARACVEEQADWRRIAERYARLLSSP